MRELLNPQFSANSRSATGQTSAGESAGIRSRESAIEITSLGKSINGKAVLTDVNLNISQQVTGLLGPNGAGKSTLIKIILGLVQATEGAGQVLGLDIQRDKLKIRQIVGYMPEDDCYIDGLTGVEMVQMSAQFFGLAGREALRRAHEILDFCGIKQERYREVSGYSTGMRQQVKFASAIVHNPRFLILDEPTTGLDPEEREKLLRRVQFLNRRFGIGVMLSTHILPDVQLVCDDVIILANGQICTHQPLGSLQGVQRWRVQWSDVTDEIEAQMSDWLRQVGLAAEQAVDGSWELQPLRGEVLDEREVAARVWRLAGEQTLCVRNFTPAQESLEAIFLKAIGGTHSANQ